MKEGKPTGIVAGWIVTGIAVVGIAGIGIAHAFDDVEQRDTVRYMNDWKQDGARSKEFTLPDGRPGMMYAGKHDLLDSWPCNDFGRLSEVIAENVNTCVAVTPRGR